MGLVRGQVYRTLPDLRWLRKKNGELVLQQAIISYSKTQYGKRTWKDVEIVDEIKI